MPVFAMAEDEDKLSLEVKEDMATLMIGVRLLLENPEPPAMQEAYKIMSKVNRPISMNSTA